MKRIGRVAAVLATLVAGATHAPAQTPVQTPAQIGTWTQVEVGVEGAFPPWNDRTADGRLVGLDIDLIEDLCRRAALQCDLAAGDRAGLLPGLNAGTFDLVMPVGITAARRQAVDFTVPYASGGASFLILKDGTVAPMPMAGERLDLDDAAAAEPVVARIRALLRGKTVGVVRSSSHEQLIHAFFGDDVDVQAYRSSPERDLDLRAGRIDAAFDSAVYAASVLDQPDGQDMQMTGPLMRGAMLAAEVAIALRKDQPELKAKLDAAIQAAARDGTIRRISEQWSKLDLTPGR